MWGLSPLVEYKDLLYTNSILCWSQQRVDLDCQHRIWVKYAEEKRRTESCVRSLNKICQFSIKCRHVEATHQTILYRCRQLTNFPKSTHVSSRCQVQKVYTFWTRHIQTRLARHVFGIIGVPYIQPTEKIWGRLSPHDIVIIVIVILIILIVITIMIISVTLLEPDILSPYLAFAPYCTLYIHCTPLSSSWSWSY